MTVFLQVPVESIIFIFISGLLSIVIPIYLMIYLFRKKNQKIKVFFVGAVTFVLFVFVLEALLHQVVLTKLGTVSDTIKNNIFIYGIYGGLAAGLFEETGRFLVFKYVLKKDKNPDTALMYGAGHGGIEAIILVGLQMIILGVLVIIWNSNPSSSMLSQATIDRLESIFPSPSFRFLISGIERLLAITLHLALSVIVFAAVKSKGKSYLYIVAILIHATVDFSAIIFASKTNIYLTELVVFALTLITAFYAYRIYKQYKSNLINSQEQIQEINI